MRILDLVLELIYPKRCVICGEILNYGDKSIMCVGCAEKERYADYADYKLAAAQSCHGEAYFDSCACVYYYDFVKYAVEHFKFKGFKRDSIPLGQLMYRFGSERNIFDNIDFMTAVPVHKDRMKERGFNHAYELAKVLEKYTDIPVCGDMLVRVKKTKPQYLLSPEERRENITGAFKAENIEKIRNKNIMLIDDIFTTGGTANECARVLKESGAKSVHVFELSQSSVLK